MASAEMMQQSQLDPLPTDLPFRIISKTIGRGAYASIKKAIPLDKTSPVFAVKLIHKAYAVQRGRITLKQIAMEVSLHSHIGIHDNIIEWFATGEDSVWKWIAMEYAEGGDLFDKIEADVGVDVQVAHLYFRQLISGVSFMHSKGVAHRDLKPENILLSSEGNLKLADFGMATMFEYKGARKQSSTMCGSPPYIAPEVLHCAKHAAKSSKAMKYSADLVDIWSCGVILFVLLVGNTPWDQPTSDSWEYQEYVKTQGHSTDDLWQKIPPDAHALLRGMMNIDPSKRFSFARIRQHLFYTRRNPLLTEDGKVSNPLQLATQMMSGLRINLNAVPIPSQQRHSQPDEMDVDKSDGTGWSSKLPATQPEMPLEDVMFDWERPSVRVTGSTVMSSTQPVMGAETEMEFKAPLGASAIERLAESPTMSQFLQTRGVPLSLTQRAQRFVDIVPAYSLARFYSHVPAAALVQMLVDALHQLNVPQGAPSVNVAADHVATLRFKTLDGRRQSLHGEILVDKEVLPEMQLELLDVRFVKVKGDPLEWRRFFKNMTLLCRDGVYDPSHK